MSQRPDAQSVPETLVLASASPRRSQLLGEAGIAFETFVVPVDEDALSETYRGSLLMLGEYLAQEKAVAAWRVLREQDRVCRVLASDTTVLIDGRSLAKPHDAEEAAGMLRELRGRQHTVATGIALVDPARDVILSTTSATRVHMRDFSDEELNAYVATGDPLDKAGAYSIQHPDFHPVDRLAGCHLGVIGLPVCLVRLLLGDDPAARIVRVPQPVDAPDCPWSAQCCPPYPFARPGVRATPLPASLAAPGANAMDDALDMGEDEDEEAGD